MVLGTSTSELKNIVYSLGLQSNFLGVYDKNFPGFIDINTVSYAIVNTGDYNSGGVHWIAFSFDPVRKKFYMFDPFGWSKRDLLKKYQFQYDRMIKNTALSSNDRCVTLVKSTEAVQCTCSAACGLFCCLFLASFVHYRWSPLVNNPIIDIVHGIKHSEMYTPYGIYVTHTNQEKLYQWLYANCYYFRCNYVSLEQNTRLYAIKTHELYFCVLSFVQLAESVFFFFFHIMPHNNCILKAVFLRIKAEQR